MKGNLVHLTPSFGPVLRTATMLGAQLPQVSATANLPQQADLWTHHQDQDHRQLLCRTRPKPSPAAVLLRPRPKPAAVPRPSPAAVLQDPDLGGERRRKKSHVSTALLLCCLLHSATVLSAAVAAATWVCPTQLCSHLYYALKYNLCLALFVYGCAGPAALPNNPDVVISDVT